MASYYPPSANIEDDAILYGDLPHVAVSVGCEIMFPNLENAPPEVKNEFYQKWENWIGSIPEKYVVQVRSSINADYHEPLEHYKNIKGKTRYDRFVREGNHERYHYAMEQDELWNKRVLIYATQYLNLKGSDRTNDQLLTGSLEGLRNFLSALSLMKAFGGTYTVLGTNDLKLATRNVLGGMPMESVDDLDVPEGGDYVEACYPSGTIDAEDGVLYHDGRYHRFLVLRDTPSQSYPFMCSQFMSTNHKDIAFTVNIKTSGKDTMLDDLEKRYNILKNDNAKTSSIRAEEDLVQLEEAIRALKHSSGGICRVVVICHLWANDKDSLLSRTDEMRMNFAMLRGATLYEPGLPVESRKLFYATLPGFIGENCEAYEQEMDPAMTSRFLPFAAVFKGEQNEPMALYQGEGKTLVGLSLFRGRPLHTCIFGSSGVGKSAFCNDLLSQLYCELDRTLIIETGNSYGVTVKLLGGKTLKLAVNGSYRLNVFDTHGAPLMSSDISTMSQIVFAMTGGEVSGSNKLQAIIAKSIEEFMSNSLHTFKEYEPELVELGYKESYLFGEFKKTLKGDFDDKGAFWEFKRYLEQENIDPAKVSQDQMLDYIQNPMNEREGERYLYSMMKSEDFELLNDYRDFVSHFRSDDRNSEAMDDLATTLDPWCGGKHGNLLNGHTNFDIKGDLVQLELEGLGDNDELKSVVLVLLQVLAFQDVLAAPRNLKKVWLFEEMGSLSRSMDGLGEIVKTIAQTGRKYNLCLLTIVQQYESFSGNSGIMEAIIGNASQFVIFRQKSKGDIQKLLAEINFPTTLTDTIMDYPMPSDIRPPSPKYSTALLGTETSSGWSIGTMMIHCLPAVLWAADSSGENYEHKLEIIDSMDRDEFIEALLDGKIESLENQSREAISV